MTTIDKAMVYRKAAEIIVRDGKIEGRLAEGPLSMGGGETVESIIGTGRVCALGACARAEWELYRTLPSRRHHPVAGELVDPYAAYEFSADWVDAERPLKIYTINDAYPTTAEDIALLLKRHAEEIDNNE